MEIEYKSEWMTPTIELMKCLGQLGTPCKNEDIGSIDYVLGKDNERKLVRAIVNEDNQVAPAYVDAIRGTIEELEENRYKEAIIISKRVTNSAHDLVVNAENLSIITPNTKNNFGLIEVLSAIQKKTLELCKIQCGKAPQTKEDCRGKVGRVYQCDIRRISDDATFHATMKWKKVLLEDFNHLCEKERKMKVG